MSQDFARWTACQRLFNVTPAIVSDDDLRGRVQFLASLQESELSLFGVYFENSMLAVGSDDEDRNNEIIAAVDEFAGKPCIVVAHARESYMDSSRSLAVDVFLDDTPENRQQAIELVKAASLPDAFKDLTQEREEPEQVELEVPAPEQAAYQSGEQPAKGAGRKIAVIVLSALATCAGIVAVIGVFSLT